MPEPTELSFEDYKRRSRRSFLFGGAAAAAAYVGWRGVQGSEVDNNIPAPLRTAFGFTEAVWTGLLGTQRRAPEFSIEDASVLRFNGAHGLESALDVNSWSVEVRGPDYELLGAHTMDEVRALPFTEMTIRHVCVEGWDQITNWQGTRFSNLLALYEADLPDDISDVYLETPDGEYYVSLDIETMRHPQTLLAYDNFGRPISEQNGAPLRLATPLKYGIKQIKRIGTIQFRRGRGHDFWGERGYDWFAGL